VLQWRCHVGHRYSPESLADAQAAAVEAAMWARGALDRAAANALRDLTELEAAPGLDAGAAS
jgi:hypothetical protein